MKKNRKKIIILLTCLTVFIFLAPRFMQLESLQNKIIDRLSSELNSTVSTGIIHWHWYPIPHISLHDTSITNKNFHLTVPDIRFFPHWRYALQQQAEIGWIQLIDPVGHLSFALPTAHGKKGDLLPKARIIINNGTFSIDPPNSEALEFLQSPQFTNVQADIDSNREKITWKLQAASPFSNRSSSSGEMDIHSGAYSFKVEAQVLNLHQIIKTAAHRNIIPFNAPVNLEMKVKGVGQDNLEAELLGDFPGFTVNYANQDVLFNCGKTHLLVQKKGAELSLNLENFELKEPSLHVKGNVSRALRLTNDAKYEWHIDLEAARADLTAVREKVLAVLGENKIARLVCDIVQGGTGKNVRFIFNGPAEDFKKIDRIYVAADVLNAPIHVPAADLDLKQVSGSMEIKDGFLLLHNLTGKRDNSTGRNGSMSLDLEHKGAAFTLDVEIDADLEDIPPVVNRLVHFPPLIKELTFLSDIHGRATGRLILGDTLNDIHVGIDVSAIQGTAVYSKLPWPIQIDSGRIRLAESSVSWQEMDGNLGPHRVDRIDGNIAWNGPTSLAIESFAGRVDAAALFDFLSTNSLRPKALDNFEALNGLLEIKKGSLQGLAADPQSWQYAAHLHSDSLAVIAGHLPEKLLLDSFDALVSNKTISVHHARMPLTKNPLTLRGEFTHQHLEQWQGQIILNGTIPERFGDWLNKNKILPTALTPRLPSTLKDLLINWNPQQTIYTGFILPGSGQEKNQQLQIDILSTPEMLSIRNLTISTPEQEGLLTVDQSKTAKGWHLTWKGDINSATINSYLNSDLLGGSLHGDFSVHVPPLQSGSATITGALGLTDTRFNWGEHAIPIYIEDLSVIGRQTSIEIERLALSINNEHATVSGSLTPLKNNLQADLLLTAEALSWENISRLASELGDLEVKPLDWDITGHVNFETAQFTANKEDFKGEENNNEKTIYTWFPVEGRILLQPDEKISIEVKKSTLCGMNMNGTWHSDEDRTLLHITSANSLFQEVLPCLGLGQDLLIGGFSIDADLQWESGHWTDGRVDIQSQEGTLLRLTLLSKIFTLINLTDLFFPTQTDGKTGMGLPYSRLEIQTQIKDDTATLKKAALYGEGLNLFGSGSLSLTNHETAITLFIAPLKSIDTVMQRIPLVGKIIGGENPALVTIPVGIKGPITNPDITPLAPSAIGDATMNFIRETLTLPFKILNPVFQRGEPDQN